MHDFTVHSYTRLDTAQTHVAWSGWFRHLHQSNNRLGYKHCFVPPEVKCVTSLKTLLLTSAWWRRLRGVLMLFSVTCKHIHYNNNNCQDFACLGTSVSQCWSRWCHCNWLSQKERETEMEIYLKILCILPLPLYNFIGQDSERTCARSVLQTAGTFANRSLWTSSIKRRVFFDIPQWCGLFSRSEHARRVRSLQDSCASAGTPRRRASL